MKNLVKKLIILIVVIMLISLVPTLLKNEQMASVVRWGSSLFQSKESLDSETERCIKHAMTRREPTLSYEEAKEYCKNRKRRPLI